MSTDLRLPGSRAAAADRPRIMSLPPTTARWVGAASFSGSVSEDALEGGRWWSGRRRVVEDRGSYRRPRDLTWPEPHDVTRRLAIRQQGRVSRGLSGCAEELCARFDLEPLGSRYRGE